MNLSQSNVIACLPKKLFTYLQLIYLIRMFSFIQLFFLVLRVKFSTIFCIYFQIKFIHSATM